MSSECQRAVRLDRSLAALNLFHQPLTECKNAKHTARPRGLPLIAEAVTAPPTCHLNTNKHFTDWGELLYQDNVTIPTIDRVIHHSNIIA